VSGVRFTATATFNGKGPVGRLAWAVLLATVVATISLSVVLLPRSAAADQISGLKTQATAISQSLMLEQLQIGAYQQQYSVASAKVAADARAVSQIGGEIGQDKQQIDGASRDLRRQAIVSYMEGGAELSDSAVAFFMKSAESAQAANEYTNVAVGNIESALDRIRAAQRTLQAHEAALERQEAQDQSDASQQASDLKQANATDQQMAVVQGEVTGQLAVAVAGQADAQAAAAARAVAAAERKAAKATTTGTTSASPGSDPALNPFLQCVVQAESGGDYGAVSPDGRYMGAFQFSQPTWNMAARTAGRPDLVGVPPNVASRAEQDTVAVTLYALDGERPWLGDRCSS